MSVLNSLFCPLSDLIWSTIPKTFPAVHFDITPHWSLPMILYVFTIFVIVYIVSFYRNVRKYPKGPFPLPLIGNLYHVSEFHTIFDNTTEYFSWIQSFWMRECTKSGKIMVRMLFLLVDMYSFTDGCFTLFLPRPIVMFTSFETIKESLISQGNITFLPCILCYELSGDTFAGRSHLPPETLLQMVFFFCFFRMVSCKVGGENHYLKPIRTCKMKVNSLC